MLCVIQSRVLRKLLLVVMLLGLLPLGVSRMAQAADPLKDSTSLAFAPDNVAFYMAGLRLREVFDKVAGSQAIARLQEIPALQMGLMMAMSQWEYPQDPQVAMFKQWLEAPENQQLVEVFKDALSHELFIYGGSDFGNLIVLINELNAASNAGAMEALSHGDPADVEAARLQKIVEVLTRQGDKLKIPTLVTGVQLSSPQAAVAELKRLENLLTSLLAQQPVLAQRFAREKLGSADYLTLRLDGSLVQPQLAQWAQSAEGVDAAQLQPLLAKLAAMQLVISIGVRDKHLIVSIGEDNKHLAQLGQGRLLYDRSELEPIRKAGSKPIVGIAYVSKAYAEQAGGVDRQIDELANMIRQALPLAPLSGELQSELIADVEQAGTYLKTLAPKLGAWSAYNFLAPDGIEGFGYSWITDSPWDTSKNLTILDHVGGDPIAFWASRGKPDPQQFDALITLVSRVVYYAEKIVVEQQGPGQQEAFEKLRAQLKPLADQFVRVTREKLIPAFADGQSALVLDAKSTSEQWHVGMPPSETALPMLEIGMVNGVSDAELAKEAFSEYFTLVQQLLDKLHQLSTGELQDLFPSEIPAIQLAKPETKKIGDFTVYYYPLPAESGLDVQVAPNAGLSKSFMASSLMPRFTARLLADTSLHGTGPLADCNRPLGGAGNLEFARLVEAIEPWITYAVELQEGSSDEGMGGPVGMIAEQVFSVLDVLKCFRGASLVIYQEGNATVTHSLCRFVDLE